MASTEDEMALERVQCIYYLLCFWKNKESNVQALINSGNEVNAITPNYSDKLGLKVCFTNVEAQKIDDSTLQMFEIVLASFQVEDKLGRDWFLKETFLLADTSVEIMLDMFFLNSTM